MGKIRLPKGQRKRKSVQLALSLGWDPSGVSGSGHLLFLHPATGRRLLLPASPSDWRTDKNEITKIRRFTNEETARLAQREETPA